MKPTDILLLEKWVELEKQIHNRHCLNASVFDRDAIRITDYRNKKRGPFPGRTAMCH